MRTFSANPVINYKSGRKLGDMAILYGLKNSPVFHLLFFRFKEALWMILKQFVEVNAVIISYSYTAVFRFRHGQLVCGLVMTMLSASFIFAFNSQYLWSWVSPFVTFGVPFLVFFKSPDALIELAFIDVRSKFLMIYSISFIGFSLFNVMACWLGYGHEHATQRGVSYLYCLIDYLIGRFIHVGLFFIHFIEALLIMSLGIYLWWYDIEPHFGWFLSVIAVQESFTLLMEKSKSANCRAFLQA